MFSLIQRGMLVKISVQGSLQHFMAELLELRHDTQAVRNFIFICSSNNVLTVECNSSIIAIQE